MTGGSAGAQSSPHEDRDHPQRPRRTGASAGEGAAQAGTSLNRTVLALLRNALGVASQAAPSNGLRQLAGTWGEAEYKQFEQAVAPLGEVDEAMWR